MKKTWQQLVKESFTKTREERHVEATRNQRLVHRLMVAVVFAVIVAAWLGWLS